MLFFLIDLIRQDPGAALRVAPFIMTALGAGLLIALSVHEFGHAWVASRLGDQTAREMGRVTLNPLKHLDPAGTFVFLVVGFGWGRPVPVNSAMLRGGRRSVAYVSFAGPASNFITAAVFGILMRLYSVDPSTGIILSNPDLSMGAWLGTALTYIVVYNLFLGIFNLIPLAPLDGSQIAFGIAPREIARQLLRFMPYSPTVLFGIIGIDLILNVGILRSILIPPVQFIGRALIGQDLL